ncbi:BnaC09g47030D [Brassica napus]|uniref:(rape) hypothetical protein n=1 Tax=Brassica napus TaxID=3708 RepID=A0A078G855_BRANA|nr:unnamed protein product [Brassica napus]CDY21589.1 BnaC09g47030D [Brassica napus]
MAATAILRSIRRRDVVSAPLSVYKSLAGNAQPSLGSYTGQNYASLCRAFGSRAGVNENVGTGFGTSNISNAVREEREHSKATVNATGAHLRALGVGTPRRVLSTIAEGIKMTEEDQTSPKPQSFRPLSPHLTVYQPQKNSMLSIFNRISGIYLTGVFYGGYLLYLKMGMICLTYPAFYQVHYHVQQQLPVITSVTALAALYHTIKSIHSLLTH